MVRLDGEAGEAPAAGDRRAAQFGVGAVHDGDQQAAGAQDADRLAADRAADGVQHDVHVAERLGEVDAAVVDDLVGAEAPDEVVLGGARRAGDVGAASLGDLDRQVADAASARVDQDSVTGPTWAVSTRALPGGETGEREGGGVGVADGGGLAGQLAGGDGTYSA